jgi:hypothetical protein
LDTNALLMVVAVVELCLMVVAVVELCLTVSCHQMT